jgi:hypothetical protein
MFAGGNGSLRFQTRRSYNLALSVEGAEEERLAPTRAVLLLLVRSIGTVDNRQPERNPPSFGIGKFLFAILLAVIFLLLVQSMVHHRFFKGGHDHRLGYLAP